MLRFTSGRTSSLVLVVSAVLGLAGCVDAPTSSPVARPVDPSANVLSIGSLRRATPGAPCTAAPYHQFDFWLGKWYVTTDGAFDGTNDVTSELDGCLVAEHWNDAGEVAGWSLNAYDRSTGLWYQHWVDESGLNLQLGGSLQNGAMVLAGPRRTLAGSTIIDRITYTPLAGGQMRQLWEISRDGGATFPIVSFDGLYDPQPGVVPPPAPGTTSCSTDTYRSADFLIGNWRIEAENGLELAQSDISAELSGCLLLEQVTTSKGYRAKAFLSFGRATSTWSRTYVDTEGHRVFNAGSAVDGSLVLTGTEALPGGERVMTRLTWTPLESGAVAQQWDVSRDGGASWTLDQRLLYVPR